MNHHVWKVHFFMKWYHCLFKIARLCVFRLLLSANILKSTMYSWCCCLICLVEWIHYVRLPCNKPTGIQICFDSISCRKNVMRCALNKIYAKIVDLPISVSCHTISYCELANICPLFCAGRVFSARAYLYIVSNFI